MKLYKKSALLLSFAAVAFTSVSAQESSEEYMREDKPRSVVNKFWDNWYIGANGGFQVYRGENDMEAKFKDRMTPALQFEAGKWITPSFGLRGVVGGFKLKGTEFENPSKLFEWDYYQVRMDVMFNVINAFNYNPKRVYEPILFAGFGWADGKDVRATLTERFGLINNFRVSKLVDINIEGSVSLFPEVWDGKIGNRDLDGLFSVTAGIAFKFPKRDFAQYDPQCPVEVNRLNSRVNDLYASLNDANSKNAQLEKDLIDARNKKPEVIEVIKEAPMATASPAAVLFNFNSSKVLKDQMLIISNMAEVIKANPNKQYKVVGYADKATGSEEYNMKLSERRAESVAQVLIDKFGVNPSQISTMAKGSSEQVYQENNWNRVAIISE
ncbi:MAG: OmpA family protein [Bacteroidales bacterium]